MRSPRKSTLRETNQWLNTVPAHSREEEEIESMKDSEQQRSDRKLMILPDPLSTCSVGKEVYIWTYMVNIYELSFPPGLLGIVNGMCTSKDTSKEREIEVFIPLKGFYGLDFHPQLNATAPYSSRPLLWHPDFCTISLHPAPTLYKLPPYEMRVTMKKRKIWITCLKS